MLSLHKNVHLQLANTIIKLLTKLGYEIVRQKGSHVRLRKKTEIGEHDITVPKYKEIAKGTLTKI